MRAARIFSRSPWDDCLLRVFLASGSPSLFFLLRSTAPIPALFTSELRQGGIFFTLRVRPRSFMSHASRRILLRHLVSLCVPRLDAARYRKGAHPCDAERPANFARRSFQSRRKSCQP